MDGPLAFWGGLLCARPDPNRAGRDLFVISKSIICRAEAGCQAAFEMGSFCDVFLCGAYSAVGRCGWDRR